MKKRLLALLLSTMMVTSSTTAAFAADSAAFPEEEELIEVTEEESFEEETDLEEEILESEEASDFEEVLENEDSSEEEIDISEGEAPAEDVEAPYLTTHATGYVGGPKFEIKKGGEDSEASLQETYPAKYITSDLPALRDQGNYSTCWAHSALGVLEINLRKSGLIKEPDLSELHLASFYYNTITDPLGGTEGDYLKAPNIYDSLIVGGNAFVGMDMISNWTGAASEELVPYSYAPLIQSFGIDDSLAFDDVIHIKNIYVVPTNHKKMLEEKNIELLNPVKKAIYTYGATTLAYRALDEYAVLEEGKVYNPEYAAYYSPYTGYSTHEVIVVGWDDNFPKENFGITPPGDGAFLIRNTWTDEGSPDSPEYNGYFWMSYYEGSLEDSFYTAEAINAGGYDNNYQYDAFLFDTFTTVNKGANVFTAHAEGAKDGEELKAVSVFITAEDCNYTVDVYTDLKDPADPESGTKAASVTATTTYAGRYTVPLDKSVALEAGETFSVVVSLEKEDLEALAADTSTEGEESVYTQNIKFCTSAHEGESFSFTDGKWKSMGDNLKIKAFTDDIISEAASPESITITNVPVEGLELGIDQSLKLRYSISPIAARDSVVTWESTDPSVAKVENGFVTGMGEGTATITATTANGKEASFTVTVIKKLKFVHMECGQPYYNKGLYQRQCYFTLEPEDYEPKDITWYSSKDSVLTIDDNGVLTYTGLGEAEGFVVVDGIRDSISFWGRYRDDEAYYEVKDNNSVLIKWTPKDNIEYVTISRGDETLTTFDAKENITEYLDTEFAENPVTEPITLEYTLTFTVGESNIPMTFYVELKPLDAEPEEEKIQEWGDITEDAIKALFEDEPSNIPESVWYLIDGVVYTKAATIQNLDEHYEGYAITLDDKTAVFCGNNRLVKGRDYTISYKDNVNASETAKAVMTITGKGNFASSASFNFAIRPEDMVEAENTADNYISVDMTKKTKLSSIKPVVKYYGKKLKEGKDYTVSYATMDEGTTEIADPAKVLLTTAGDVYYVFVNAKENGNFTGSFIASIVEVYDPAKQVPADKLTVGDDKGKTVQIAYEDIPEDVTNEGLLELLFDNRDGKTPKGHVKYKGKELEYGTDYELYSYESHPGRVGEHVFYLKDTKGAFAGAKECNYKVTGFDISKAKIAGLSTTVEYTGSKLELEDLFNKKDKNLNTGWNEVTLYKQDKSGKVKLTRCDEDGKGDYEVFYDYIKDAGKYTVIFMGMNGCTGAIEKTITVKPYDIKKDTYGAFSAHANSAKYSAAGAIPEVTVTFGGPEGMVLTEGVDYTLTYKNNKKIATRNDKSAPTVMVKGIGNFKGTVKGDNFTIFRGDARDLYLSTPVVTYNAKGKDGYFMVTPKVMDGITAVSFGDKKDILAVKATDFEYTYSAKATMVDGTEKEIGSPVLKTDRPVPGTEICVTCTVKTGAKNKYNAGKGAFIGGIYRIVDADKDISKSSVSLTEGKKLSVYYSSIKAEDLVVTLKGESAALKAGTDYYIDFVITNKSKKTITVVLRGYGFYGGSQTVTFKVVEGL